MVRLKLFYYANPDTDPVINGKKGKALLWSNITHTTTFHIF